LLLSLSGILQLSDRVSVESERLLGFSAGVVEGHVGDVLVPGRKETKNKN